MGSGVIVGRAVGWDDGMSVGLVVGLSVGFNEGSGLGVGFNEGSGGAVPDTETSKHQQIHQIASPRHCRPAIPRPFMWRRKRETIEDRYFKGDAEPAYNYGGIEHYVSILIKTIKRKKSGKQLGSRLTLSL